MTFDVDSPSYVPSPYGAWLAISSSPSLDSFSNWFRFADGLSFEFNSTIILKGIAAEGTNRYISKKIFFGVHTSEGYRVDINWRKKLESNLYSGLITKSTLKKSP